MIGSIYGATTGSTANRVSFRDKNEVFQDCVVMSDKAGSVALGRVVGTDLLGGAYGLTKFAANALSLLVSWRTPSHSKQLTLRTARTPSGVPAPKIHRGD